MDIIKILVVHLCKKESSYSMDNVAR